MNKQQLALYLYEAITSTVVIEDGKKIQPVSRRTLYYLRQGELNISISKIEDVCKILGLAGVNLTITPKKLEQ